jgi:phage-related protein
LRNEHLGVWYRRLYAAHAGWVYVLHCFNKKTNKTSLRDLNLAKDRFDIVRARKDKPLNKKEERSA